MECLSLANGAELLSELMFQKKCRLIIPHNIDEELLDEAGERYYIVRLRENIVVE